MDGSQAAPGRPRVRLPVILRPEAEEDLQEVRVRPLTGERASVSRTGGGVGGGRARRPRSQE